MDSDTTLYSVSSTYTQSGEVLTWYATTPSTTLATISTGSVEAAADYFSSRTASGSTGSSTSTSTSSSSTSSSPSDYALLQSGSLWTVIATSLVGAVVGGVAVAVL
ncbi:hypothetical protein JCM8547_008159 [Rhodosporidiobolus lusitaniae]